MLTERTGHLLELLTLLEEKDIPFFALYGRLTKKKRNETIMALEELPSDAPRVLLATGRLIGEGFDHPPLDTLVLGMPVSWKGTLQRMRGACIE